MNVGHPSSIQATLDFFLEAAFVCGLRLALALGTLALALGALASAAPTGRFM